MNYLFDRIMRGLHGIRPIAISSLVYFLKRNYLSKKTNEIMKLIVQTFFSSSSYQNRMIYLEIYDKLAENYSKKFFRIHNLNEAAVKLGEDKVPDVRKALFEKCVTVRRMLNSNETALVTRLDEAVNKNKNDPNKRVAKVYKF